MKSMKDKMKQLIVAIGERTAYGSVGKSDPFWVYEVEIPDALRSKFKNKTICSTPDKYKMVDYGKSN